MKLICILLMICLLVGGASADALAGASYSREQALFMEGPTSGTFEPLVERYWSSYLENTENVTPVVLGDGNSMGIWYNTFPQSFEKPVQLSSSTFSSGGIGATGVDPALWNSLMIERDTTFDFGLERFSFAPETQGTGFSLVDGQVKAISADSKGQILSQGIMNLFGN